MRFSLRPLALAGAAALLVTACGGSKASSSAISGLSPQDIVKVSAQSLQQGSLRYTFELKLGFDASKLTGLTAKDQSDFNKVLAGFHFTGKGEQESPTRVHLTLSMQPIVPQDITVVLYDDKAYYSLDGKSFGESDVSKLTGGLSVNPKDFSKLLDGLGGVKDLGQTQQDGLTVEHLQVTLDSSFLDKALGELGGASSGSNPFGEIFKEFVSFTGGTIDLYVLPDNAGLERESASFAMRLDFDKLRTAFGGLGSGTSSSGIPGGSLGVSVSVNAHFFDQGAKISVTKPTVDPNAPELPGGVLGGGLGFGV
jgi:hypothetical protein